MKTELVRLAKIATGVTATLLAAVYLNNCNVNIQPQNVTVTGTILGEDGAYTPVDPVNIELTHVPAGSSSARVIDSGAGMQNQQRVTLEVVRTGIPLTEEYWFLNISRVEPRPGSEDGPPAESTGDPGWVRNHRGDMAVLGLRPDMIDSPLSDSLIFPGTAGLRLTGNSYLGRVETDDPIIPFSNPSAVLDISRLSGGISTAIGNVVTSNVNGLDFVTMGGADGAGDFRMYFVPHILHSTLSESDRNVKGVGFIFRFTANVTIGLNIAEFKVYIPISILMEPGPATGGGELYRVGLDPFSFIGGIIPSDNLNRITVIATGLFEQLIADQLRTAIVSGISAMPQSDLDNLELLANGLAGLINSFRDGNPPIPNDWDVILLPEERPVGETIENLVSPSPGGVAVKLVILE